MQGLNKADGVEWGAGSREGREGGEGSGVEGKIRGRAGGNERERRTRGGRGVVRDSLTNAPLLVAPNESVCTAGASLWSTLHAGQRAPNVAG